MSGTEPGQPDRTTGAANDGRNSGPRAEDRADSWAKPYEPPAGGPDRGRADPGASGWRYQNPAEGITDRTDSIQGDRPEGQVPPVRHGPEHPDRQWTGAAQQSFGTSGPTPQPYPRQSPAPFQPGYQQAHQQRYQQPYPGPGYPPPGAMNWGAALRTDYAHWGRRVGALLIDSILGYVAVILFYIWYIRFFIGMLRSVSTGGLPQFDFVSPLLISAIIVYVVDLGLTIWNRWITAGRTGQSIGKRVLKIRLISETTGEPIGAVNAFLRDLLHTIDGAALVGYLWPLWDERRQTLADKLMHTVVVNASTPNASTPNAT